MSKNERRRLKRKIARDTGMCHACFKFPPVAPYTKCQRCRAVALKYLRSEKSQRRQKDFNLRRYCGISLKQKEAAFESQKGLCLVCNLTLESMSESHSDHNHATNAFRGLLHAKCNLLVGWLEKHYDKVPLALRYLQNQGPIEEKQ